MKTDNQKSNLDWSDVEEALAENSASGHKIAILETDKIFREYIDKFPYLGSDSTKKMKILGELLNKSGSLSFLKIVKEKIIEEKKFDISREDAKEIISEYWEIIKNFDEFNLKTRRAEKFRLRLRNSSLANFLKFFTIGFAVLVMIVEFFGRTKIGKEIISATLEIADLLSWEIIIAAGLVIILFIVFQIKKHIRKKKQF